MSAKELLHNLTQHFSSENLVDLFRNKSDKFRPINEEENQYNNAYFSSCLLFGEITLDNEEQVIIYTFKTTKELTERSSKKAQYELAKKILKEAQRYAAGFFIFYDDNGPASGVFRLSLVYDTPQPNGKREWSNFKRFTYYVRNNQTNKTFINRLDAADFTTLGKIKEAFSVEKVTKEFYTEIANWYFWSLKHVKFPKDAEVDKNGKNIALIRFITRIIFIWFMKQKNLISNVLFNKDEIKKVLKNLSNKESTYYKAILQNLFFATLNTPIKDRKFRRERSFQGKNKDYMEHTYYRYHSLFNNPDDMLNIFKDIPFLNGGLFECLDKSKDDPSNDTGNEIRIDGFSDKEANQTIFPNELFFSDEKEVDLNKDYGTAKKKYKTRGLLNILQAYNFTIDENTPADEEIALDPELLGRVFENLLASYNPETASTARKATGSYYTPREIVNYMVDESLIAYLKNKVLEGAKSFIELSTQQSDMFGNSTRKKQLLIEEEQLPSRWINKEEKLEKELRKLISYSEENTPFADKEIDILINAINTCKILDPAVGSGAFPMGALHKLVLILSKLDPHNNKWKQQQISAIEENITDPKLKHELTAKIEESFSSNELDYGRKLYLLQNCLYGVDIQPIAIQIAKLRFFISLLVDEKVHKGGDNFGIEPLPNLETKLVSANTLIGLSQDTTLKPLEIEKLEKQLFDIRRNYFVTSDEKEKKALERNDRENRQKIKESLIKFGFPLDYSEKISSWDPYNTNTASGWFDSEWMFGPDVKNGFNIVIGNPPYGANYSDNHKKYFKQNYFSAHSKNGLKGSLDTFSLFIDKSYQTMNINSFLIFIVPLAITSSESMSALHNLLLNNCETISISTYSNRPKKIFDNADQRVAILSFIKNHRPTKYLMTTKVNKRYEVTSVQDLINNLQFVNSIDFIKYGRFPKVGSNIEINILRKIFSIGFNLKSMLLDKGLPIFYRSSGGRYYNIITNYTTGSSKENSFNVIPEYRDIMAAVLSSNLYYWFYHIYSNTLDLKTYELEIFPIPVEDLIKNQDEIELLYKKYLDDLHKNSIIKQVNYAHIKEYREYYARKSKHLIDKIDLAIKDAYGLTDEEINFIINYDIEFRTDDEEE